MEGSSGFQGSMQADYQYLYQPLHQPMGQTQQFHGEHSLNILTVQASDNLDEWMTAVINESPVNYLKWTDEMARLLITAVSYVMETAVSELHADASSRKLPLMPKMTKWKVISMVMGERGYNVSPQQCAEKFSDINKKYIQMIGTLGRATSCKVVENPILLDSIDVAERQKEEVRKLLSSEQFLYREMCSLYHGNRLFLPHDWELRRSVMMILAGNCDEQPKDQDGNLNETGRIQNEREVLRARSLRLEEQQLEVQQQRLQFEKEKFNWLCFKHKEHMKLERMRLANESMKLEIACMAFELRRREMNIADNNS